MLSVGGAAVTLVSGDGSVTVVRAKWNLPRLPGILEITFELSHQWERKEQAFVSRTGRWVDQMVNKVSML